jgi:superfamily II DNA or RNA helicase
MEAQSKRTKRQLDITFKWNKLGGKGTLLAATGFGKTRVAVLIVKRMKTKDYNCKITVIVPTINLKTQWEQEFAKHRLSRNTEVKVVNTACREIISCSLLILDEIHEYGGPEFSKIFENIEYKFILGLSATIEDDSPIYKLTKKYCPIFEEVTLQECLENKWVSNYVIYNLAVDFTEGERKSYNTSQLIYTRHEKLLGGPLVAYKEALSCIKGGGSKELGKSASLFWRAMSQRKKLIYGSVNKLKVTQKIVEENKDKKILIFSQSIEFANKICRRLLGVCVTYHSKMKKSDKETALNSFLNPKNPTNVIAAVQSLDSGLDDPDINFVIVTAGNSKPLYNIQRIGRVIRAKKGKRAIIVNLYTPDTQEVVWLNKRQKDDVSIWITKTSEII